MSNFDNSEDIDTTIEEVLEDIVTTVVSDSRNRQIETTIQSVLQDIVAMELSCRQHDQLGTCTDDIMNNDELMVKVEDLLVDVLVHLVLESLSSKPHVQPEDASVDGEVVLQCGEEKDDIANSGDFEVVVDDVMPIEGSVEARIVSEVLDGELDPGLKPATHAVTSRGRIRRFAASAWRGVKRAGRVVLCCGCYR